jgi:hypothetical protein
MRLLLIFSNGLGHSIALENNTALLTTEGVGKAGVWNYTGTCNPNTFVIKGGDQFVCRFDIDDTEVVPTFGKNVRFKSQIQYIDCETDIHYISTGGCARGSRRTIYGEILTPYVPYTYLEYCGNGFCNATAGENESTCSMDCQIGRPIPIINVTSPVNYINSVPPVGYYYKQNIPLNFTIDPASSRLAYSLDGARDVTLRGNTSIPGPLSNGGHSLTVYADWNSSLAVAFRYCLGDINMDYRVDSMDVILLAIRFGTVCGDANYDPAVDLNDDCAINQTDVDIFLVGYHRGC